VEQVDIDVTGDEDPSGAKGMFNFMSSSYADYLNGHDDPEVFNQQVATFFRMPFS
jgi:hypothetical protein